MAAPNMPTQCHKDCYHYVVSADCSWDMFYDYWDGCSHLYVEVYDCKECNTPLPYPHMNHSCPSMTGEVDDGIFELPTIWRRFRLFIQNYKNDPCVTFVKRSRLFRDRMLKLQVQDGNVNNGDSDMEEGSEADSDMEVEEDENEAMEH